MEPTKVATAMKSVTVEAIPFFPEVDQGAGSLDVMVRVRALAACTSRVPIDLVAVLACGSSMSRGAKPPSADKPPTQRDLLKRAMNFIVKQLRDGDSIAVVAESSTEVLEIPGSAAARESVEKKVDELMATKGAAALKPGLQQAVKLLDLDVRSTASANKEPSDRLGFIVLLSDGGDDDLTQVKWDKSICPRRNYTVHTFGFGAAHDPKQLFSIAQESGGTYSFVRDDNLGEIMEALAVCLGGLKSVVAVDTRVKVTTDPGSAAIGRIQHGAGFTSTYDNGTKASAEVVVGTLYAGEVKSFKVEVQHKKCKPEQNNVNNNLLFTARVEHRHTPASSSAEPPIGVDTDKLSMRRPAVIYPGQLLPSNRVAKLRAQLEALDMVDTFRAQVIDGLSRHNTAAGIKHGDQGKKMKSARDDDAHRSAAGTTLKSKWEQLKQGEAMVVAGSRNTSYMQELDGDIHAMADDLNGGGGAAAYLYSWFSCHAMQRATTVGSPHEEFLTKKMKDELTEAKKQQRAAAKRVQATATKKEKDEQNEAGKKKQPMAEEAAAAGDRKECGGVLDLLDSIERRLECWDKLKDETPLVFPAASGGGVTRIILDTEAFRKESIEGINQAMHKDVYLAVVHAIKQKHSTPPTAASGKK